MSAGDDTPKRAPFAGGQAIGAVCIAAVLALSNFAVRFVINDWLTWAAFLYPLTFLVIDCMNRVWGSGTARRVVYFGFAIGVPMSFLFNFTTPEDGQGIAEAAAAAARIAGASGMAFLTAQLLDIKVFNALRRRVWWIAPAASSTVGSVVDTFLFFFAAFAFTGVPWATLALGDLAAKGLMVVVLLPLYRHVVKTLLQRTEPGQTEAA